MDQESRALQASDEGTLTEIVEAGMTLFWADGAAFAIRQPTTEEYDDALGLQGLVLRRTLALPEVAALRDQPCSPAEQVTYRAMIAEGERAFQEAEDGSHRKQAMADEIARLERALENRTLADEIASERAILARDRWLTIRLLQVVVDGKALRAFDPNDKQLGERWEALARSVKDAARPAIWAALALVRNAPFSLEALRGSR